MSTSIIPSARPFSRAKAAAGPLTTASSRSAFDRYLNALYKEVDAIFITRLPACTTSLYAGRRIRANFEWIFKMRSNYEEPDESDPYCGPLNCNHQIIISIECK
jgi:hypothetical protein